MQSADPSALRALLVGIDGGSFNVLDPLFERGELPTLKSLFSTGASGRLESQIPPWTPSAWPSIYTGTNPGKHGVFGFLAFDGYDWDVVDATRVGQPTVWELLDHHGHASVVVNAPVTHPPPAIEGAVVPGYTAPNRPRCHPEGLLADLDAAVGGEYRIYPDYEDGTSEATVEESCELVRMRGVAFRRLVERFAPAFGFVQFQQTDTVLHEFPGDRERAAAVYRAVDEQVECILADCDPHAVFVVSDHGMDAYDVRFRANEYLRNRGFVAGTARGDGMPSWAVFRGGSAGAERTAGHDGWATRATAVAAALGLTSQRVAGALDRVGLADAVQSVVPDAVIRAGSEQVDFGGSRAYVRSRVECGVRLNLAGREPDGVVPPEEYDAVRSDLISVLRDATLPDGSPVFETVAPRESFFEGPYVADAVDVVTVPRDFEVYVTTWLLGDEFETPEEPAWDHVLDGVFAAAGDGVDAEASVAGAHVFDVAPTVLSSMGVPAHERTDGEAIPVVAAPERDAYDGLGDRPERPERTEDGRVEETLADLGYIE